MQDIAESIGVDWAEVAQRCVALCGGKEPESWDSLSRLQADRLKAWLVKRAEQEPSQ